MCISCTNSTNCASCIQSAGLTDTNTCSCPSDHYYDGTQCSLCTIPMCITCSGKTNCTSCILNSTLTKDNTCACLPDFFWNGIECSFCINPLCSSCSNITNCTSCIAGALLSSDNTCSCPNYYYANLNKCSPCSPLCLTCLNSSYCTQCISSAILSNNGVCSCQNYYYPNDTACILCPDQNCINCSAPCNGCGNNFSICYQCNNNLLFGVCVDNCPAGFFSLNHNCTLINNTGLILSFSFEGSGTTFYDSVQNLPAYILSTNSSRRLQTTTPTIAYMRGLYFPGSGSLQINSPTNSTLLSSKFSFSA